MKRTILLSVIFILGLTLNTLAQPYIVNEKTEKIFSEDFSDPSKNFPVTSSNDPKYWGAYADGYYFMERKVEPPRVIMASSKGTSKDFYIKTKLALGKASSKNSSIGVIFLAQPGGRGGFVFEFDKKKRFRIRDIGANAVITKEGEEGWIKSKSLFGLRGNNRIEIKGFRGQFDIYINDTYAYSFESKTYKKGGFGAYISGKSEARMIYFNVYNLSIPGAPKEIVPEELLAEIESLKKENDSLKLLSITAKYGGKNRNKAAIQAIKILEDQVAGARKENKVLKDLLAEYEKTEILSDPIAQEKTSTETVNKINDLTTERDSLVTRCATLEEKIKFMETQIKEVQSQINHLESKTKTPATPSTVADQPKLEIEKTGETQIPPATSATEQTKENDEIKVNTPPDVEKKEVKEPVLLPLSKQKIPVKKAIKGEFKD